MVEGQNNKLVGRPKFDFTINISHIFAVIALASTVALAYTAYRVEVTELRARVMILEGLTKALETSTMAVHAIRTDIVIVRDRLERMERDRTERDQDERQRRLQWERERERYQGPHSLGPQRQ